MSVINNVLKDLESRSSQFTPIEIASINQPDGGSDKSRSLEVIGVLLAVILVAVGYWLYFQQNQTSVDMSSTLAQKEVIERVVEPVAEPVIAEISEDVPVNQIIGLQIKETPTQVSLEFSLREKAISYLKERSQSHFVYHLKNIDSEIVAPLIRDNRWIENLALNEYDEGVDVAFETVAGVLVNTEQVQKSDELTWIIRLEKLPDPVVVNAAPESGVEQDNTTPGNSETVERAKIANLEEVKTDSETQENLAVEAVKLDIKSSSKEINESNQFKRAKDLIKSRDWKNAETLLLGLIDGPQDSAAREQLLGLYAQPAYAKQYASLARQSNARYPDNDLFKAEFARVQFQDREYQSAVQLLQSIAEPNSIQLALTAASHQRLDQHEEAVELYRQSLRLDKQQPKNWIGLGISLEHSAQLKLALQSYLTAAKMGNLTPRLTEFVAKRSKTLKQVIN